MTRKEIEDVILRCAGVRIDRNGETDGIGSIAKSFDGEGGPAGYDMHYRKCVRDLEALPWNVVDNPRRPKDWEYPKEDGVYLTMLDCDEHALLSNTFRGGYWTVYHKTHVKWWMKLPEAEIKEEKRLITKQFLENHGFEYLERFGFWHRRISFPRSHDGMAFRYRYDKKELETQRYYVIGAENTEYHSEEDGYKLIKEYDKEGLFL